MKKQAHMEYWDFMAAKLAMADPELHAKCVKLAWSVNTTTSSSHHYHYPVVDAALSLIDCPGRMVEPYKPTRYLLRALKRASVKPTTAMTASDVEDFVRRGQLRKPFIPAHIQAMDLSEIEARTIAWLDDKTSGGK